MQPKPVRTMKTYGENRSNQKYAANSRNADHTEYRQRFYLRFCWQKSACARRFSIFSSTSEMMTSHQGSINKDGIRDNIQLSRKHQRAVAGKPNNDPSWSSPHVECTTTVSLRKSYRNAYQPNRALRALTSETFLLISRPGHVGNVFTIGFIVHDLLYFHLLHASINGTAYRKLRYYFSKLSILWRISSFPIIFNQIKSAVRTLS